MDDVPLQLSVLFADVSGSARLYEKLGSAEALRAVDRCMRRMERTVDGFSGHIVKIVGDELMATFSHADEALQAAIEMQQRVSDLPPISGVKLEIRVGFAHGEVVEDGGNLTGETVNLAASLAGLAEPSQILTSTQTQTALSPALRKSTRDLGPSTGRGKLLQTSIIEAFVPELHAPTVAHDTPAKDTLGEAHTGIRLRLHYKGKVVVLDANNIVVTMGRDQDCDVVIHDRRASRKHATVEWKNNQAVLIDRSTNGTFVTPGAEPEVFLRRKGFALSGTGTICFAASASAPDVDTVRDCARFEQID